VSEVFISYKRENLAAVNRLVEALRAEGVSVWWDQDIPPNAPWEATIERELAAAKLVIVAWSPASVASDNVKAEARWARGQDRLLQVFVEACEPPLFFGERQGVDLNGWSGAASDPAFRTMLQAIRAGPTPTPQEAASEAPPAVALSAPFLPGPKQSSASAGTDSRTTIAVLPLSALSQGTDQSELADGLTEEIVRALSGESLMRVVVGRKGDQTTPREAGRRLGAHFVLDGSVRQAGGRVRVSVKLTDSNDGAQVWTERFEGDLDDVFGLQDRTARKVAGRVGSATMAADVRRAMSVPIESASARDLLMLGLTNATTFHPSRMREAIKQLDRSIALDPMGGMAIALAAWSRAFLSLSCDEPERSRLQAEARAVATRALDLDPTGASAVLMPVSEALFAIGEDTVATRALIDRAVALAPASPLVHFTRGWMQVGAGELEAGIAELETALELDPVAITRPHTLSWLAVGRMGQGQFREAVALLKESAQLLPAYPMTSPLLAACYGHLGEGAAGGQVIAQIEGADYDLVTVASHYFRDAELKQVFLEGIALARDGTSPETA
jgi:TolB-like protein